MTRPLHRPAGRPSHGAAVPSGRRSVLRGSAILSGLSVLQMVLRFGANLVLVRLMAPEAFGLAAAVLAVTMVASMVVDAGLSSALVRRPAIGRTLTDSVFWCQVGLGAALTVITVLAAPWIERAITADGSAALLRLAALIFLANGVAGVPMALLQRQRKFGRLALADGAAVVLGIALALGLAFAGVEATALVAMWVLQHVVRAALAVTLAQYRPQLRLSWRALSTIWPFGRGMMVAAGLDMLAGQADKLIIVRLIGTGALGLYHQAQILALVPIQLFAWTANAALLPELANRQHDPERMRAGLLDATRLLATLCLPCYGGLAAVAPSVTAVIFGSGHGAAWSDLAPVLEILCLWGALTVPSTVYSTALVALGRADVVVRLGAVSLGSMIALVTLGALWGTQGAAAGLAATAGLRLVYCAMLLPTILNVAPLDWARALAPSTLATLAMAGAVAWAAHRFAGAGLPVLVPLGVGLYVPTVLALDAQLRRVVGAWSVRVLRRLMQRGG